MRIGKKLLFMLPAVITLLALSACSTKKNTPASRNWQAFTTRYNVYYNGHEHFVEQLKDMEGKYEDDYTRIVLPHPADARADQKYPQPVGDFKRTIEKMQKAIQLHSIKKKPAKKSGSPKEKAFRAREEFNPFLHNAWLTLGKGQYYNGDFLGAAATFYYITKHFKWLPDVVTEALLWQARSYSALDWDYETENVLRQVKPKMLTSKSLTSLYNLVQGSYYVRTEHYKEAVPYLEVAAKSARGSQKNRLWFLLGQAYEHAGNKRQAYLAFRKAGSGASTAYRTKFNARIKQSEVFTGGDIRGEVRALRGMTRYQRNSEFLDQIYYAIANLYMSRKDTAEAKKNYILAVEKSTRNGIDKALAQLSLGNIYFAEGDYVKAQSCYSEAIPQLNESYPGYKMLKRRSDVLDELAVYAGNVHLQDSLLTLAAMPEDKRLEACKRLAEEYTRQEEEAKKQAALEAALENRPEGNDPMSQQTPSTGLQMNTDKSWYFYNTMTKNAGKNEFVRRWGSRKPEDDWRRRNKTTFSLDEDVVAENDSVAEGEEGLPADSVGSEAARKEADPHFAEYYMKQIPSTEEEINNANEVIQEGLYNMGLILKDKLEDFQAARREFLELNRRYPDNIYRLDAYYNLYLMDVRERKNADAERWRAMIIEQFPDSPYGKAMLDPDYFNKLREMHSYQEELYADAYGAYLSNKNREVHSLTERMEKDYPLSKILPKFVFIDALSYLTEGDNAKFRTRLEELLQKWPDTDLTPMAGAIVKGLREGREPRKGTGNTRGLLWDIRLTNDSVAHGADGQPANFERDPNKPQYLVLAFPRDSVSSNLLLYDVARFNFSSFVVKDFDLEPMSFGNVGLLIIKGFSNLRELEHYRSVMAQSDFALPEGVRPIMISKANFELLLREGRSFEDYFRFQEQDIEEHPPLPDGEAAPDDESAPEAEEGGNDAEPLSIEPETEPEAEPEAEETPAEPEKQTEAESEPEESVEGEPEPAL